jgi:hypothetical protein
MSALWAETVCERGQRYSTVMVRAPRTFQDGTLWPEFCVLSNELKEELAR